MRFNYEYRTTDNTLHEGVLSAPSRDDVYSILKTRGIRPSRVVEAPGFLNKLLGKYKRWMAIVALAVVLVAVCVQFRSSTEILNAQLADYGAAYSSAMSRRQIYGDPELLNRIESENYISVFDDPADRFLAHYARPGRMHGFEGELSLYSDRCRIGAAWLSDLVARDYSPKVEPSESDAREIRELKQIVLWMRGELSAYLANGNGTTESYVRRLEERQRRESEIYNLAKVELAKERDAAVWERRNDGLRAIGLPTISPPQGLINEAKDN